ncbi:MAG: 3-deoxy-D-manno-octulosonic acid transferase [Pseudomonadota bacterium]|nr:3-deoxy-D-manno-octulosonic acid transferase [Pseudomonadota bacterium]
MLSSAYRLLTDLGAPVIQIYLRRRLEKGREDAERFPERLGIASQPRPEGRLIWCHAASVGEATSFLALIERLQMLHPQTRILITSGTVSSAKMLADRLPHDVIHQYVPVDRIPYIRAFLDHWRPSFALWVESELWPNTLAEIRARHIPAVLLNGSISDESFRRWYRVKGWATEILRTFSLCLTQTDMDRSRFVALGAKPVRCFGNLKYAANPLPFDALALGDLRQDIGGRPLWLMASTHPGEEEMALEAHQKLLGRWPDLVTVIVPRHAQRGDEIVQKIANSGLTCARRSKGDRITKETGVYLADTMGELGLFYRLCRIMCMGGSFVPVGGHNPIEPAQLGCVIIFGPYMHSQSTAPEFIAQQGAIPLQNANEIPFTINRLLEAPETLHRYSTAARILADQKRNILAKVMSALEVWLNQPITDESQIPRKKAAS